jgi:hypothetical protein
LIGGAGTKLAAPESVSICRSSACAHFFFGAAFFGAAFFGAALLLFFGSAFFTAIFLSPGCKTYLFDPDRIQSTGPCANSYQIFQHLEDEVS